MMKTLEELRAFCEGFVQALTARDIYLDDYDEWIVWGGYDINFAGADYTDIVQSGNELRVDAYQDKWIAPVHSFTVEGYHHVFTEEEINRN